LTSFDGRKRHGPTAKGPFGPISARGPCQVASSPRQARRALDRRQRAGCHISRPRCGRSTPTDEILPLRSRLIPTTPEFQFEESHCLGSEKEEVLSLLHFCRRPATTHPLSAHRRRRLSSVEADEHPLRHPASSRESLLRSRLLPRYTRTLRLAHLTTTA
jgi:hypothetical protein